MSDVGNERLEMAIRNIMSGDNECGTLLTAAQNRDGSYFRKMIAPIIMRYEQEMGDLRRQRDEANRDIEMKRFALEMVVSNVPNLPPLVIDTISRALPGRRI